MQNIQWRKKAISLFSTVALLTMLLLTSFASAVSVSAATPQKMLEVNGQASEHGITYKVVPQEENVTYTFSCDYYSPASAPKIVLRVLGSGAALKVQGNFQDGQQSTLTVTFNYTKANAGFPAEASPYLFFGLVRLNGSADQKVYCWNFKLTASNDPNTNLLAGADFSNGTLNGWLDGIGANLGGASSVKGISVVDYDESIWNPNLDDDVDEEVTPKMLKMTGTGGNAGFTFKLPNPTVGATYTFSFKYKFEKEGVGLFAPRILNSGLSVLAARDITEAGMGQASVSATISTSMPELYVSIDTRNQVNTTAVVYMWDIKLTASGSATNLLTNPNFATGDLSGWLNGLTPIGAGVTSAGKFSVVDYDEELLGITPKMLEVNGKAAEHGITYKVVPQAENVTYTFSCDYYMPSKVSGITLRVLGSGAGLKAQGVFQPETKGTLTVNFNYTLANAGFSEGQSPYLYFGLVRLGSSANAKLYCWNFKLTASNDPDTNLLPNSDFFSGTLGGWLNGIGNDLGSATTFDGLSVVEKRDVYAITADEEVKLSQAYGFAGDVITVDVRTVAGDVLKANGLTYTVKENTYPLYKRVGASIYTGSEHDEESANQYIFTLPAGDTTVNAAFVAEDVANVGVFGTSIRKPDGNVTSGLQFGSRVNRAYGDYTLITFGTLLWNGEAATFAPPAAVADLDAWVEANAAVCRKVECTKVLDRCDAYYDYAVRLVNITEKDLADKVYTAKAYAIYSNGAETIVVYSDAVSSSYNQAVAKTEALQ